MRAGRLNASTRGPSRFPGRREAGRRPRRGRRAARRLRGRRTARGAAAAAGETRPGRAGRVADVGGPGDGPRRGPERPRARRRGLGRRAALVTVARKPGYGPRAVRLAFRAHPRSTMRIYRRALQWTMYGAGPTRTQAQTSIAVRPPFRVVWSRGLGSLVEFPAVVQDGVAYIANADETVRALDMRTGVPIWRHDTPGGKSASS